MHADGAVYGECPSRGVLMSQEGPVTFRGNGAGRFTDDGGASFRGRWDKLISSHRPLFDNNLVAEAEPAAGWQGV